MDQAIRNKLRGVVTQCRKLLEDSVSQELQGKFGIYAAKKDAVQVDDEDRMNHLGPEERTARKEILEHYEHIQARGFKPKEALDQLVREIAYTHLNRLCAYKMMEARQVYIGDQKFREAVSRGVNSNGVKFYLAEHQGDERLFTTGRQDVAYRHFLDWLGGLLSEEIGVLFSPHDSANRLYPPQKVLDEVLELLNDEALAEIWTQDETIGWVYQYFTPKELRDQARKESQAPRNSYELAFRNQFFTPRYVVEFLTDNTLGRIWYEMRKGDTRLKDQCRYMVRRPTEVFLAEGESPPDEASAGAPTASGGRKPPDDLPQEELLKQPVHIPHRPKKDPRELKILDPACGSGHFLLYCFDLLLTIYEEAYADPDLGPALQRDYPTPDALRREVPRLILAHNLHGIDIDLRATQIAALALWLRCQRAYQELGLKKDRPKITRSNIVCAEPMPGEEGLLEEFLKTLHEDRLEKLIRRVMQVPETTRVRATEAMAESLCELVRLVWDKMKLAGEAGSLLKIEEEIQDAIRTGQEEWEEKQPLFRIIEFGLSVLPKEKYVRIVPGEGVSFWERAEALVMAALDDFAAFASNGKKLLRKLFVDDAVRGFAFVDLCRQRFDVVLMNPPFDDATISARSLVDSVFPSANGSLYLAMADRALSLSHKSGMVGALGNRTLLHLRTYEEWRRNTFLAQQLLCLADLGYGEFPDVVVQPVAYVLSNDVGPLLGVYISLLKTRSKQQLLLDKCGECSFSRSDVRWYHRQSAFSEVPNSVIAYWADETLLRLFRTSPKFETDRRYARQGLATADDFRFVRLRWEVPPQQLAGPNNGTASVGIKWFPFSKGGDYSPYYSELDCVVNWENDGESLRAFRSSSGKLLSRPQNIASYFKAGLTYSECTTSDITVRPLPAGAIFGHVGLGIIIEDDLDRWACLGAMHTRPYRALLELIVGSGDSSVPVGAVKHYTCHILNQVPWPDMPLGVKSRLADWAKKQLRLSMVLRSEGETSPMFRPEYWSGTISSLRVASANRTMKKLEIIDEMLVTQRLLDHATNELFKISQEALVENSGSLPTDYGPLGAASQELAGLVSLGVSDLVADATRRFGGGRHIVKQSFWSDRFVELLCHTLQAAPGDVIRELKRIGWIDPAEALCLAREVFSICVGVVLGRWDVRFVVEEIDVEIPGAFNAVPVCSAGMLKGTDGLPPSAAPANYPLRIDWDGILVDDGDHSNDIVRRMREILEVIWKDRSEAIEKEACEILGVKELRDYFRKPGKGGFWDDHVSRYSKSRRKAPIYWLLQSSRKNYALWLYYHRLDKDLLFKALVNYVEPKIQRETNRLGELRRQKEGGGASGKGAKKLDKEIERQEDLISELRDFEDKLRRAANLHLEPDLNDGVVLNIAPLHELVPWKEAKNYWEELLAGKYEWSTIGKQLRAKGLVTGG